MKWKDRKRCSILVILIITLFVMNAPIAISAKDEEENQIGIEASINFGQSVKCNRLANILITISNQGDSFQGYLQTILVKNSSQDNCMYQSQVMIKSSRDQIVNYTIPITEDLESTIFRITDEQGNILVSEEKKVNMGTEGSVFYLGVIGEGLDYIRGIEGKAFKPIAIADDEIPEMEEGLDMFEGIYIGTNFIKKQIVSKLESIREWINDGGTVLLGSKSAIIEDYLGLENVTATAVNDDDGTAMYKVYDIGQGVVIEWVYTSDLDDTIRQSQEYAKILVDDMQTHYSDEKLTRLYQDMYTQKSDENQLLQSLEMMERKYLPRCGIYIILIIIYAIFVGPVLYFVLSKLKRNLWYYVGVVVVSVAFVIVFVVAGSNVRIRSPIVHSITLYNYEEDIKKVEEETYFSIVMPNKESAVFSIQKESDIEFKNTQFQSLSSSTVKTTGSTYNVSITKNDSNSKVQIQDPLYMKPYIFKSKSSEDEDGEVTYDLLFDGKDLTGNVVNNLGFDLENAILVSNFKTISVGELKDGESFSIPVEQKSVNYYQLNSQTSQVIERLTGIKDIQNENALLNYRKYSVMSYCLKNKCLDYNNETYLVGFIKKNEQEIDEEQNEDVGLVIYHLTNTKKEYEGKEIITDISKYENQVSGSYNSLTRTIDTDSVVLNYYLPTSLKIDSIVYLNPVNEDEKFEGTISIYDNKNQEYQNVFCDGKTNKVKNLESHNFISSGNKIIIKYTLPKEASENNISLIPVLSAIVEEK